MSLRLPKPAAAIRDRIKIEDAQYLALRRANSAQIRRLKEQRGDAESRRQYLEEEKQRGRLFREITTVGENGAPPSRVREADEGQLRDVVEEIAGIDAQLARLNVTAATPRMTAVKLEAELDEFTKYMTCSASPTLKKGEDMSAALVRTRKTIEAAKVDRKTATDSVRTYEEVRERALGSIRVLAERGVPKVLAAFRGGDIELPKVQVPNPNSSAFHFVPDGAALLAWLFQAELEKRVDALLEFNRGDDNVLSAAEQTKRIQQIDDRLMTLYREEAAIVESIVAEGGSAYHFSNRPAAAVLGIRAT